LLYKFSGIGLVALRREGARQLFQESRPCRWSIASPIDGVLAYASPKYQHKAFASSLIQDDLGPSA
jgi:hypothetical protein